MLPIRHGQSAGKPIRCDFFFILFALLSIAVSSSAPAAVSNEEVERLSRQMLVPETRAAALDELVGHGPEAVQPLAELYAKQEALRPVIADALLRLANDYPHRVVVEAIPAFVDRLHHGSQAQRIASAQVLGEMGASALPAVSELNKTLKQDNPELRSAAAAALASIAEGLHDKARQLSLAELQEATTHLQEVMQSSQDLLLTDATLRRQLARIRRSSEYLALLMEAKHQTPANILRGAASEHPVAMMCLAGFVLCYAAVGLIFWVRPVMLTCQGPSGTWLRRALLIHWFACRPRTMDAWVEQHIAKVRQTLAKRAQQEDQDKRIPVPVRTDGHEPAALLAAQLRPFFSERRVSILVHGEGGVGKTNLAFQLARWALEPDAEERLCPHHLLLPIIVRASSTPNNRAAKDGGSLLLQCVRHEITELADLEVPPAVEWVVHLLSRGRVLLIVDDLSETSGALQAELTDPDRISDVSMLIVTTRNDQILRGAQKTVLEPVRLADENIDDFVRGYIQSKGKAELFQNASLKTYCTDLRRIAARQSVTVLMAKLYAELVINRKLESHDQQHTPAGIMLPTTVPELMLSYLNYLNRGSEPPLPTHSEVHQAAKRLGWACLKRSFVVSSITRKEAVDALDDSQLAQRWLNHLEKLMRLLKMDGASGDRLRFALDPLAEYLAALWLISHNQENTEKWHAFLAEAEVKRAAVPESVSFLRAVLDCCESQTDFKLPGFVPERLRRLVTE